MRRQPLLESIVGRCWTVGYVVVERLSDERDSAPVAAIGGDAR